MAAKAKILYKYTFDEKAVAKALFELNGNLKKGDQLGRTAKAFVRSMFINSGYTETLKLVSKYLLSEGYQPAYVEDLVSKYIVIVTYMNVSKNGISQQLMVPEFDTFLAKNELLSRDIIEELARTVQHNGSVFAEQFLSECALNVKYPKDYVDELMNQLSERKHKERLKKIIPFFNEKTDVLKFASRGDDSSRVDTIVADMLVENNKWGFFEIEIDESDKGSFAKNLSTSEGGASLAMFFFVIDHLIKRRMDPGYSGKDGVIRPTMDLSLEGDSRYATCLYITGGKSSLSRITCMNGDSIKWGDISPFKFSYRSNPNKQMKRFIIDEKGIRIL